MSDPADPIPLARDLIRCASVTPTEAGALDVLEAALKPMGFVCRRYPFGMVDNLYARLGDAGPNFCFAGHVDVVPAGDMQAWTHAPFAAEIAMDPVTGQDMLWGRGARDMKGAVAAFTAAIAAYLKGREGAPGSISLLITCDEEGPAVDGTKRVLTALAEEGEVIDHCLVGEPTNPEALGDMLKNGRRGSLNAHVTVHGVQGHVAYPHQAANPVPVLLDLLDALRARRLDDGAPGFQPSNLEISSVDVGNPATNVIPAKAEARFNIRFNTAHSGASLCAWIEEEAAKLDAPGEGVRIDTDLRVSGEPFHTAPGEFVSVVSDAVEAETGRAPELSTSGGTSDARFIRSAAEVCEFGLVGKTIHEVNERAPLEEIRSLARIYRGVLERYFDRFGPGAS